MPVAHPTATSAKHPLAAWFTELKGAFDELQSAYGLYKGAEYRAVLQDRSSEGYWVNVLGRLLFSADSVSPSQGSGPPLEFLADPGLHLLRLPMDLEEVWEVLKELAGTGAFSVPVQGEELVVKLDYRAEEMPFSWASESLTAERFKGNHGIDCPGAIYHVATRELVTKLGVQTGDLAPLGFNDLEQMLYSCVYNPTGPVPVNPYWYVGSASGLRVALPFHHARLGRVIVDGRKVNAEALLSPSVPLGDFSLVLRVERYPTGNGSSAGQEPPVVERSLTSAALEREFGGNVRHAEAKLFWNKTKSRVLRTVDSKWAERAEKALNPQTALYEMFDPSFEILNTNLRGGKERDAQVHFEWAVAHLLSLAGFRLHWFGYLRGAMKEGEIDVLGWSPEQKWLLLAECTLRGADVDKKILNLVEKASVVEKAFQDWQIKKALFTTFTGKTFQGKTEEFSREKAVILVTIEALDRLARIVEAGHPIEEIWEGLRPGLVSYPDLSKH